MKVGERINIINKTTAYLIGLTPVYLISNYLLGSVQLFGSYVFICSKLLEAETNEGFLQASVWNEDVCMILGFIILCQIISIIAGMSLKIA